MHKNCTDTTEWRSLRATLTSFQPSSSLAMAWSSRLSYFLNRYSRFTKSLGTASGFASFRQPVKVRIARVAFAANMTLLRYIIRHVSVRNWNTIFNAQFTTIYNCTKSSTKTVCDTTDVTSGFLNIDKRNKFGNMAAPMASIFLLLKLLIIKHRNICWAKKPDNVCNIYQCFNFCYFEK